MVPLLLSGRTPRSAIVTVFELQAVLLVSDTATDPEPGTYLVGMSLFPELATPLQVSP
jgi:hypothetical protein